MALVNQALPNLINGVSQQPAILRLPSQCELQENFVSSPIEGLTRRAGTTLKGRLMAGLSGTEKPFTHAIRRDEVEEYVLYISDGDLKVFDLDGVEKTVSFPNGKTYLASAKPDRETFRAVTVADYTFIVNREKTVQSAANLSPSRPPEAMVWVKQADFASVYSVRIDGTLAAQHRTDNDNTNGNIATNFITNQLYAGGAPTGGGLFSTVEWFNNSLPSADWTTVRNGSIIWLRNDTGDDFSISAYDSNADNSLAVIKDSVQSFTDLPKNAFRGFEVRVEGDENVDEDDYYLFFDVSQTDEAWRGVWKETLKGGEEFQLVDSSMPWGLVRESDGTFTFDKLEWLPRKVGDLESNPFPSFVGQTINDIFFHRNRLGLLSGENIVMSKAGEYFDFFRDTATQVLDSDPIDVAVTTNNTAILEHAVPFDRTVVFLSNAAQFMLSAVDILTPETIAVNETTTFDADIDTRPARIGKNFYFCSKRTTGTIVREYFVDYTTETEDATDVTGHVPSYIPPGSFVLSASHVENVMVSLTSGDPNSVYVYRFYWAGAEKLQSSWSRYTFPYVDEIYGAEFFGSRLILLTRSGNRMFMEELDFSASQVDAPLGFMCHLDRKVTEEELEVTYNSATDETTLNSQTGILFDIVTNDDVSSTYKVIAGPDQADYALGESVPVTWVDNTTLKVPGNLTKFWAGRTFVSKFTFSTIYPRSQGDGQQAMGLGRLQLRYMTLSFTKSTAFDVEIVPSRRSKKTQMYRAAPPTGGSTLTPQEGRFRYSVMTQNLGTEISISSKDFLPCSFSNAEWEGLFTVQSRRLGA